MSSLHLLLLFVVWVTMVVGEPLRAERSRREILSSPIGKGEALLTEATAGHILFNAPRGARLIATQPEIPSIYAHMPDNYTLIRENVVDTFTCNGLSYGYYADEDNDCQIFHVCLPLRELYPANFTVDVTYRFSFICPKHTVFSQDVMVCAWEEEALPCEATREVLWQNRNFFRVIPKEDGDGTKWAEVNSPLD